MILDRVHPAPVERIDLSTDEGRARALDWYRPPASDWVRLNLVTSVSGSAAGPDGTSETLTNAADRRLLGVIRELSDVVLVGAASVRAEGYQVPRRARLAIATRSGRLEGHRVEADRQDRVTVVCPRSAIETVRRELPRAEIVESEGDADVVAVLRQAGYRSIVCEGGPSLASALVAADLVDDLCLTTSPVLREVSLPAFAPTGMPDRALRLEQLALDESGYVFSRWSVSRS